MARDDWAAVVTDSACEYSACIELERFGLRPYLPQLKRRHHVRPGRYVMRSYPLWPRYLLIPANEARDPALALARGVFRSRPVLSDSTGRLWLAPNVVIAAVKEAEETGVFDEILRKGKAVTFSHRVLASIGAVMTGVQGHRVELLTPLFGNCRAVASASRLGVA